MRPRTLYGQVHQGSPAEPTGASATGERKKVSGLESRRGHAVLSSVLIHDGPQATYGDADEGSTGFSSGTLALLP